MQDFIDSFSKIVTSILDYLNPFFTFQNLSFMLGLIGSAGTAWTVFQSRVRISMRVVECSTHKNQMLVYVTFQNKSRLPISIENVSLVIGKEIYPCVGVPTRVDTRTYRTNGEITGHAHYYNMTIPINLVGLAGASGYILFVLPRGIDIPDSTNLTFQISPNRGRVIETKCQLPQ